MVTDDTPDDDLAHSGRMLPTPIAQLIPNQPWASQQHLVHILQSLGYVSEHLRCIVRFPLVVMVTARLDALRLNVFAVKHQNVGFLLVNPNNGVKSGHYIFFLRDG